MAAAGVRFDTGNNVCFARVRKSNPCNYLEKCRKKKWIKNTKINYKDSGYFSQCMYIMQVDKNEHTRVVLDCKIKAYFIYCTKWTYYQGLVRLKLTREDLVPLYCTAYKRIVMTWYYTSTCFYHRLLRLCGSLIYLRFPYILFTLLSVGGLIIR